MFRRMKTQMCLMLLIKSESVFQTRLLVISVFRCFFSLSLTMSEHSLLNLPTIGHFVTGAALPLLHFCENLSDPF